MMRVAVLVMIGVLGSLPATADLTVLVTIPPHASLVERLGGDAVTVKVVLAAGESPATYDPSARRLQELADARLWFTTGAPLEPALQPRLEALAPGLDVVATHAGLHLLASDDHGHDHGHDHGDTDPHVWLSARNTELQAVVMAGALADRLPERRAAIDTALAILVEQLRRLDADLVELLAPARGRTLFVFHPAFGYFCHDYDLRQAAVESGGLAPSPRHLAGVLTEIRDQGAHTIFIQPQYSDQVVQSLAREADLAVVVLDPLARDHLTNLRHIGDAIARGLEVRP